jgi:hypothetical protein
LLGALAICFTLAEGVGLNRSAVYATESCLPLALGLPALVVLATVFGAVRRAE